MKYPELETLFGNSILLPLVRPVNVAFVSVGLLEFSLSPHTVAGNCALSAVDAGLRRRRE